MEGMIPALILLAFLAAVFRPRGTVTVATAIAIACVSVFTWSTASATVVEPTPTVDPVVVDIPLQYDVSFVLDRQFWSLLVGVLIPIAVGIVTRANAPARLKAIVAFTASVITGVVVTALEGTGGVVSKETLIAAVSTWAASVAAYLGLWKQVGLNYWLIPGRAIG